MTSNGVLQVVVFFLLIVLAARPFGVYMARVFSGEFAFLRAMERFFYRVVGVDANQEQHWTQYAGSLLSFSFVSFLFTYLLQRLQGVLPLNPAGFGTEVMTPELAFNTAVSFVTNTNWQAYGGESTMSYLVQMAALTVQNFASAAAGLAVAIALTRGFARQQASSIGNFWVDLTRGVLYVLLPLSVVGALFFCSQGVIQNLSAYTQVTTVEGRTQVIAQGPVASQEAIKMLGTNGGGFFNANSSHPFENPTPLTNLVQMLMIFVIPAGLTYTFGRMTGDQRQGWAIFSAMAVLFLAGVFVVYGMEQAGNPELARLGVVGGNMEGKEVRFGIAATALFATITTAASCGAVNGMHDSLTPLGGLVPLFNMQTGEVIFGGVGAGLYGVLLFAVLAVFIAGLMVGRTPEYLGKKIEGKEVKMAMLAMIATAAAILLFTAAGSVVGTGTLNNAGPHGFAEILYAYTSAAANNGSAFAGIGVNTPWYNVTLGIAMLVGRFFIIIPMLAVAGSLAAKKKLPVTTGTLPTHGPLFVTLLVGTIVIVGALTFFPALSLSPIAEHFLLLEGRLF
ncbi:potassium-transporting ATPase potassium-binding subunit [Bryobacterales bacterium F-183]|nr:potassium-transporting ATPase potassium-binding subunit [Bryobacterales bacterium F-183]